MQAKREMTSNWSWDLHLEISAPIGGPTSKWRFQLQLEVPPPNGGLTSDWRSHLQLEVPPPNGGPTSKWRCHLQMEVSPPGGIFSYHLEQPQYLITSRTRMITTTTNTLVITSTNEYISGYSICHKAAIPPFSQSIVKAKHLPQWLSICHKLIYKNIGKNICHSSRYNILFGMCTCISTCIYLHLTPHVSSTPYG